jgi:NAD-dependent SIR2 family protein deacetylase
LSSRKNQNNLTRCAICEHLHDFELPHHIVEDLYSKKIVLFAGAGISTENKTAFSYTLYDDVKDELGILPKTKISFSKLMTKYCAQTNGRRKLLEKIHKRFQYIESFPEIHRFSTRFHRELSTLFFIDTIITTNWDNFFESECGFIPFVTAKDFALWDIKGRKVFKIHGSINNYGSIIATNTDYNKCYKGLRDGILGATIKCILGTKTLIYVGYSFADEDFVKLHRFLKQEMGSIFPKAYIVTIDRDSNKRFEELGLTPIYTDATHFISILKKHAVEAEKMLDDNRLDNVLTALFKVQTEHELLNKAYDCKKHPEIIYASSYQDGLIHAFERMLALNKTGYYSDQCNTIHALKTYEDLRKKKIRKKEYFDVAYIEGYINGLIYILSDDKNRKRLPLYYMFGVNKQPRTITEYRKLSKKAKSLHKTSYTHAKNIVAKKIPDNIELVLHHPPFI